MHKIITLLLLALPVWAACPDSPTGYSKCLPIPVDNTKVSGSSDLTNFVGWVDQTDNDLRTVANGGSMVDGNDIRFQIAAAALDYELISYSATTGQIQAWVRIPTLDYNDDTAVYIYYGKTGASGEEDAAGTWVDYESVIHHDETDGTATAVDSSGNANGTPTGTVSGDSVAGKIGNGLDYDGVDARTTFASPTTTLLQTNTLTVSAWVRIDAYGAAGDQYIHYAATTLNDTAPHGWSLGIGNYGVASDKENLKFEFRGGGWRNSGMGATELALSTYYYIAGTYDQSNARVFLNGVQDSSAAQTDAIVDASAYMIGRMVGGSALRCWDGVADEVRVTALVRTADWLLTEYNNQNSPSTFFVKGTVDTVAGASAAPMFRVQAIIGTIFWRSAWLLDYWQ